MVAWLREVVDEITPRRNKNRSAFAEVERGLTFGVRRLRLRLLRQRLEQRNAALYPLDHARILRLEGRNP